MKTNTNIVANAEPGVQTANASAEATTSDRTLQIALAAWRQGNFVSCEAYLSCR
ncbi:MAG: hypothetical protein QOH31_1301 [Verrucomicrobiota bacterium]|jgi:hypothetical protein